ncbi:NAD(P)H-dependent oxidoreductase [Thalassotalea ponticola]|uniref:NADPH-dependent FMN reductase n=1 Tax=Thalassotalea ponticola TaxID=1523392 RepID=UPI0025B6071E|nr:NAD(P)H-dependent oxidoreductase [Thalassotalea ponticola]MDN3651799.1 NAD(P)H-dependent oxidoreductase [Thalassotalea ponticola]
MKIIAFAASSSSKSINKQLVTYAANMVDGADVEVIDLNDYQLPLFSEDAEAELGKPELAQAFFDKIGSADALVISYAEHNGSYTAAFKNLFDWTSRVNMKVYQNKSMILLATSPGPGGAKSVLATAQQSAPFFDGIVKGTFSLPSFYDNFDVERGKLINEELNQQLQQVVSQLAN